MRVLINIFVSPFGIVKFKHFFLADILTSMVYPLKDMGSIVCFFASGTWLDLHNNASDLKNSYLHQYQWLKVFHWGIAIVPFWFRLMQCFRRYYDTKLIANLKNAGKYFTSMCVQVGAIFFSLYGHQEDMIFYGFVGLNIFSTCYSYYWDLYMDWGLLRSQEKGKRFLRNKMLYPTWFYYYAAATNLVMRCMWIIPLFNNRYSDWFINSQANIALLCVVEAFRRAQWALIRIENENVNNFERYRNVLQIPEFKDMVDEQAPAPGK